MIEKLKQIENKLILDLLSKPDEWSSFFINDGGQKLERCQIRVGNYDISVEFIHKCEKKYVFIKNNEVKNAFHVVYGGCEIGILKGNSLSDPHVIFLSDNGSVYQSFEETIYFSYIFPTKDACSSVSLSEKIDCQTIYDPLSAQRKLILIKWFEDYYRNRINGKKASENDKIKKGDWVKLEQNSMSSSDKRSFGDYISKLGFVIGRDGNFVDIRFGNDRVKIHVKVLTLLEGKTNSEVQDKDSKKVDDMDPKIWDEDSEEF